MRREIDVMRQLNGTPGVMPILDSDEQNLWYVMPIADGDLKTLRESLDAADLIAAASGIAEGLRAAHSRGLVHRDVTPTNVLRLPDRQWVVADWGVVRRPLGMTTKRLTEIDKPLGTDGFAAPEVLRDSHGNASPAADVYSLGRVMSYAVTGQWPLAGERRPPDGAWRSWVRDAIRDDPDDRATLDELVDRLQEVGYEPSEERAPERAAGLAQAAATGDEEAAFRLLELADDNHDDAALFFDFLPATKGRALDRLVAEEQMAERLVSTMRSWLEDFRAWDRRDFDDYNRVLGWFHEVASAASRQNRIGVLEDVADALFAVDYKLDRWRDRDRTQRWLTRLGAAEAAAVARSLRRSPEAASWIARDWQPANIHPAIGDALRN